MPNFSYRAKKNPQEMISGVITAGNYDQAVEKILHSGYVPLEVVAQKTDDVVSKKTSQKINLLSFKASGNSLQSIYFILRQLTDLLEAGVPLMRSLEVLSRQIQQPRLKMMVQDMMLSVRQGSSLSDAMSQHPDFFSPLHVNMTRTGESSGNLTMVLERLSLLTEKEMNTRAHVLSSLMYPLIVLAVGVLTIFVLLTFVLPRLTEMFNDFDTQLPLPTLIVIGLSDFFGRFGLVVLVLLVAVGFYFKNFFQNPEQRLKLDTFLLRVPILGEFFQQIEVARFSRSLGTLLEGGVSITQALDSVCPLVMNQAIRQELVKSAQYVREGTNLAEALKMSKVFSEGALSIIAIGEESGKLQKGLLKLAHMAEQKSDEMARTFVTLLGPLTLVVIVAFVGFMVIAMLLPIFKMNLIVN